jgi:hypothetical protein
MKKTIITLALFIGIGTLYSQNIEGTKYTIEKNENGNWYIVVRPVVFNGRVSETTKLSGIYALKLCYRLKGKYVEKYKDVTKDFVQKKQKWIYLASSSVDRREFKIREVKFFRRDLPRETWPKKDCYNHIVK